MPEFASAPPPARQRPAGPSAALRCVLRPSPVSHLAGWIFHPKSTPVLEEVDEPDDMGHEGLIACSVISRDVSQTSSLLLQIAGTSRRRVCVELVLAAGYRGRLILRWASTISIRLSESGQLNSIHKVPNMCSRNCHYAVLVSSCLETLEASCSTHYLIDRIPLNYPKVRLPFVLRLDLRLPADTHLPYRVLTGRRSIQRRTTWLTSSARSYPRTERNRPRPW